MPNPPHEQRRRQAPPAGAGCITVSFRPAIPRRGAPQQRPLALRRPRQSTSKLLSGTIDAGQSVLNFLVSPTGCSPLISLLFRKNTASDRPLSRRNPRFLAFTPAL